MKKISFETEEEWMEARKGKITGSTLGDVITLRGNGKKVGYWQLLADRLSIAPDEENPLDRGHRLEEEAMARFEKETGKEVDASLLMWVRDDNESIAISPDGIIGEYECVEIKCLKSAKHLEAYFTQKIPDEYYYQVLQYFIVNDSLETLYFVMYDPRVLVKDYFVLTMTRAELGEEITKFLEYQRVTIEEINRMTNELTLDNF